MAYCRTNGIRTHEQRLCVWFLRQEHEGLSPGERAAIFNTIFEVEQAACGIYDGLDVGTIESQFREHRKAASAPWQAVMRTPYSSEEIDLRAEVRAKISATLASRHTRAPAPANSQQSLRSTRTRATASQAQPTARVSRKRSASGMRTPTVESDSDEDCHPLARPSKVARTARVVIPPTPESERRLSAAPAHSFVSQYRLSDIGRGQSAQLTALPQTPLRTSGTNQLPATAGGTNQYHPVASSARKSAPTPRSTSVLTPRQQLSGTIPSTHLEFLSTLDLTPETLSRALLPIRRVPERLGKPGLPPILYRYSDENSSGINAPDSPQGFVSGRHQHAVLALGPAPACAQMVRQSLGRNFRFGHSSLMWVCAFRI
jgi:hypothetical protein